MLNFTLPPLESVADLARSINESIIPDEVVQEVVNNANASRLIAEQALETAQNARYQCMQRLVIAHKLQTVQVIPWVQQ